LRNAFVPLGVGEFDRTLEHLRTAATLARALGDQYRLGWVALYLSNYFGMTGNPDCAIASDQRALALADELGMRPLQAHGHRSLGTLHVKVGQREQASAELSAAIALYRAMAMTFWLPQAEAPLAQVDVP
jgi:tetratricopeptide (TPR) repeat protein